MKNNLLLLVILLGFYGCVTVYNPATQKEEIYFVSDEEEIAMGKNLAQEIINNNKIIRDRNKLAYLVKVGEEIANVCDRNYLDYHFYILDKEGMNAFSLPGGYIFVNDGLLEKTTEGELAFVLAHEIGHICARHSVKRLQASLGASIVLSLALKGIDDFLIKRAIDIVYNVVSLGYARKDEFLADALAVKYTYKAGYNPLRGISLMEKLKKNAHNDYTLVFLRSHPPVDERIANIKRKIEGLKEDSS